MNIKKLKDIKIKAEQLGEWMSLDFDTKSISEDMTWLVETIENQQAEMDTLSMSHDNLQRELSKIKRLMGKDKHALIKSNISLNKRVQELEQELHFCQVTKLSMDSVEKYTEDLKKQNKRYREALEAIAYSAEKPDGKIATRVDARYIASKALEGESSE